MRTNIDIDDKLMAKAMKASRLEAKSKKGVVEEALQMLVNTRAQEGIWKYFGKVPFWDGYDYKAMRRDTPNEIRETATRRKSIAPQQKARSPRRKAA